MHVNDYSAWGSAAEPYCIEEIFALPALQVEVDCCGELKMGAECQDSHCHYELRDRLSIQPVTSRSQRH
jgi:hypothetical protein